ncbi:MAG TPA: ATP-binding protein, partial [Phycisphaerales bacterium]|nr:ATP-binding protein [Phycisphaerales bacterium]
WYDTPFGLALLVWFMISLGVVVVWWTAGALGRADAFRSALQEDLAASITREHATASQRGAILDALPQAIALLDARGTVVSVNRGWGAVASDGDGARRAVGAVFADWGAGVLGVQPDVWTAVAQGVSGVLTGVRPDYLAEIAARPAPGEPGDGPPASPGERERWLEVRVTPMNGGGRSPGGAVVTVSDVTERRRLEEQLVHAQRLEAVGRLAGGVAHDFNNLLTAVTGHRALAQAAIEAGQSAEANLQAIEQAARSGAELTQELLAFGRRQVLATRVVSVTELVGDVRRLIDRSLGESVQLRVSIPRGIWPARVDPARIEQVLMNLVINARDAIAARDRDGARGPAGSVVIDAVNADLDEAYAAQRPGVEPGPYVCISVSDNGTGMSKQVLGRIFEPFFTTKARGKGSGLGLATSFGIVKQHGGHIAVYSEEGRGTTFRVYLPAAEGAEVEPTHPAGPPRGEGGHERILLVDDHQGARAAVAGMLRSLGYAVVEAADAAEAERVAGVENDRIDLLLCDVVLPDAQGPDLAHRLRDVCPRAAVLFISGYTADAVVHHGSLEAGVHFLSKPFTLDELAAKVRSVLLQPR